ncbi:MAG: hypothetical protein ACIAQ0_05620 [Phycisphaerales bacterium JB058]
MMEWLLGIDRLAPGDPDVVFALARPMPAWAWAMIVLAAGALGWISYTRLEGSRVARMLFALMRSLVLLLLVLMLAGPELRRPNERVERDWLVVMADRSASMTIGDAPGGEPRETQLAEALIAAQSPLRDIAQSRRVLTLGFDAGVFELAMDESGAIDAGQADGRRTLLGRSLDRALDEVAARPVSGVVLLSDGTSADAPSRRALQRLRSERIPVFVVPIGSPDRVSDLAIASVRAPAAGLINDRMPVTVDIDRLGSGTTSGAWVELVDRDTGEVLERKRAEATDQSVTLVTQPGEPGDASWLVRLVPDEPDLLAENNAENLTVTLVDRPLRALQIDGYPRWEFRYTKNLLLREQTISSSSLLLSSRRRYVQEGDVELTDLPDSPGAWEGIDVIVIGDVRADLFTTSQLEQIHDLVALRGAGILWIAGPSATPDSWRGTPLEPLLPITLASPASAWNEPVTMRRELAAERLGLLELADASEGGWPERLTDPDTGWAMLRWAQKIDPDAVKPTAEVLASALPANSGDNPAPIVLSMRYGAGRSVYVGTDEIWRWRYARGEELPERFWIPLVRLIGREGLARAGRSALLEANPPRTEPMSPVRITLELLDERLALQRPQSVSATVHLAGSQAEPTPILLRPEEGAGDGSPRFAATWLPASAGAYEIAVNDALLLSESLTESVEVLAPDDELRRPETDFATLRTLAEETGGRVLTPGELAEMEEFLPNRQRRVAGTPDIETLWDSPLALILLVLLLGTEWIGRRMIRLV